MQNTQVLAESAAFVFDSIIRSKMPIKKKYFASSMKCYV